MKAEEVYTIQKDCLPVCVCVCVFKKECICMCIRVWGEKWKSEK